MSIKTTQYITRQDAIDRIIKITLLVKDRNFYELEKITNENDTTFSEFIQDHDDTLNKFRNATLCDIMDSPFYRFSMFDNYEIKE